MFYDVLSSENVILRYCLVSIISSLENIAGLNIPYIANTEQRLAKTINDSQKTFNSCNRGVTGNRNQRDIGRVWRFIDSGELYQR